MAAVSAFQAPVAPSTRVWGKTITFEEAPAKGSGGMYDTRDPEPFEHEDKRKSISAAPSFEEYLKSRQE